MAVIRLALAGPQISLVTWPSHDSWTKQPKSDNLPKSIASVSIWVKVTACSFCNFVVSSFFLLFSFTPRVILLNLRGWKWAKIRLVAVYPIHRPRRLRAARPTFSIFPKLMRAEKSAAGSQMWWKLRSTVELPPFPRSEWRGRAFLRGQLGGKRVEVGGETVTGVSGPKCAQVPHTILCNPASAIWHPLKSAHKCLKVLSCSSTCPPSYFLPHNSIKLGKQFGQNIFIYVSFCSTI